MRCGGIVFCHYFAIDQFKDVLLLFLRSKRFRPKFIVGNWSFERLHSIPLFIIDDTPTPLLLT